MTRIFDMTSGNDDRFHIWFSFFYFTISTTKDTAIFNRKQMIRISNGLRCLNIDIR